VLFRSLIKSIQETKEEIFAKKITKKQQLL
jgi:hypothetical protein